MESKNILEAKENFKKMKGPDYFNPQSPTRITGLNIKGKKPKKRSRKKGKNPFNKIEGLIKQKNKLLDSTLAKLGIIVTGVLLIATSFITLKNSLSSGEGGTDSYGAPIDDYGHYVGNDEQTKIKNKIIDEAQRQGVDPSFALAIAKNESGFRQNARSGVGAIGVFQIMPATAKGLGINPYDLDQNIYGGIKLLAGHLKNYGGDKRKALAAYNWGSGNLARYGIEKAPSETRNYIKNVLASEQKFKNDSDSRKFNPDIGNTSNLYSNGKFAGHRIISTYGKVRSYETHKGIDLDYYENEPVYSFVSGTVYLAGRVRGYEAFGILVVVEEDGRKTRHVFGHLNGVAKGIYKGKHVDRGELIGYAGSTGRSEGVHLHYGIWVPGGTGDRSGTYNPLTYQYTQTGTPKPKTKPKTKPQNKPQNKPHTKPQPKNQPTTVRKSSAPNNQNNMKVLRKGKRTF